METKETNPQTKSSALPRACCQPCAYSLIHAHMCLYVTHAHTHASSVPSLIHSLTHTDLRRSAAAGRRLLSSSSTGSLADADPQNLADLTHWLCSSGQSALSAHNNTAMYGPCIATVYSALVNLEITGLPTRESPCFAGETMQLAVLKKDFYGQTMTADSSSALQLRSAKNGERGVNDASVFFLGSIFSGFQQVD